MVLIALLLAQGGAVAQETTGEPEPEVVITPSDDNRVKEYRVNGRLYMIEVTPSKGPHYFLVDTNGDGTLDSRQGGAATNIQIPRWILLSW